MSRRVLVVCLVMISIALPCRGRPDVGEQLDLAIQRQSLGQFWGAVLVARDGEVLLARGYGLANGSLTPNSRDTLFDIGSITKCFTAAAILRLEQDGKLSIDDPISTIYPETPDDKKGVTIRHLLNHTSGISAEARGAFDNGDDRDAVAIGLLRARREAEPGARFKYSNAGYFLLAAIVERASGATWERYLAQTILAPAGMTGSGCCGGEFAAERLTDRVDRQGATGGHAATWPYPLTWGYRGAGGVVSSVADMYAWDRALRTDAVLGALAREKMFTPALNSYALGWEVRPSPLGRIASHTGGVRGYATSMTRWLDRDACVIVLTNERNNPVAISKMLSEILFPSIRETVRLYAPTKGRTLSEHGMIAVPPVSELRVDTGPDNTARVNVMMPGDPDPAVSIDLSPATVAIFLPELEAAIAEVDSRGAGKDDAGMVVEVYTAAYGLAKGQPLERQGEGVSIEVNAGTMHPEEGGTRKVLVFVRDQSRSMLPMFMKLQRATAQRLLDELRRTLAP